MTNGIDLAPGSSSIGIRVHSRCGVGNEARESMDLSDSSLDLTAEIEELRNAFTGEASPPPGGGIFSPVGPSSVIGVEEVANWKRKFHLPDEVTIRIPGPFDRVSDFELGEIPVYEGFFESGFRDRIPSLVAEVLKAVKISPGQLNPISWRTLIAIQNLGDLKGFTVGVVEVLYCYSISPLNGGEFRYHLHPRGKGLPVSELSKAERKCCPVFEGHWTSKFSFMSFPGFSPTWCAADTSRLDYSTGRDTIERLLELPLERREVSFLVSDEVLDQCSIRGNPSIFVLPIFFLRMKAAVKRTAPVEDEEVQLVGSSRRRATTAVSPSSSKKKSRASGFVPKTPSPASFEWSVVLSNLNAKVVSQLFHLGERMEDKTTAQAEVDVLTTQLREGKDAVLAKEKDLKE
ncbi:hypothetical protein DY000_02034234 [Brassica cretica]|uniref:Uncharacterized protein n=1 Tax=Brassica cretica TaxID=69181 RepID=A0ABQ7DMJ7_BRACR|nr:hypothetical protein DY000_02034234 [Brassica cretica]